MSTAIKALILSPAARRAETALTWLLLAASAGGLILMFTGSLHLAPLVTVLALSSLALANAATVARHLATPENQRGPFPHRHAASTALVLSIYPMALFSGHLEGRLFQLAASAILLSMLYLPYALWQQDQNEDRH